MLEALRISPETDPDFTSVVSDLLRSTSRILIVTVAGICALGFFVAILIPGWVPIVPDLFFLFILVALTSLWTYWLLGKQLMVAQLVWLSGITATITLASYLLGLPEIAACYALLPLLATLVMGSWAGLVAEGITVVMTFGFTRGWFTPPLAPPLGIAIALVGVVVGVLGWAGTRALLTVTEWSLFGFEQARRRMAEAFEQRLELKQTQEDLVLVNNELARLSERLILLQRVAEEARQAKEEFVANVSHELRTPLNLIIGFSETITRSPRIYGADLPPALLADIGTIQRNSEHLARLVNDVLDLSQVDAGRMALSKEWSDLTDIVASALGVVRPLYASKHLRLTSEVEDGLPLVYCDSTRVRQVIINLLSNAGRFTERGGVAIRVQRDADSIVVGVADTGPGISPEDQQRLFEPFQQLDTSIRRRHGGSGLGLSISKRFVELHGGRIWVESPSPWRLDDAGGPGTYIRFSLPITQRPAASLDFDDARRWFSPYSGFPYHERTRRPKAPMPEVRTRYVVLEGESTLQPLLQRYMPDAELVSVGDADQAIQELSRLPADALIINEDATRDGARWRTIGPDLPFGTPLLSCRVPGGRQEQERLGVVRYLVKPISAQDLLGALAELGDEVRSILLVDDEPETLKLFSRMISGADRSYQTMRAMNGERALQLLRQRKPDVLVADLIMPGMDGFRLLREKAQDPAISGIPAIVTSSRDPTGGPVVSRLLSATKGQGLSMSELVAGIRSLSEALAPSARSERQASQPAAAGSPAS